MKPIIAPSLLAADLLNLEAEIQRIEALGLPWLHFDHMDGHFVPNIAFGPDFVAAVRRKSALYLDVHLMLDEPLSYVERYAQAGADGITVHVELDCAREALALIRKLGKKAGIALNPGTPAEVAAPLLDLADMALVMTVQPGFGGQSMKAECLAKAAALRALAGRDILIEADGGINAQNAQQVVDAGGDVLVMGTGLLRASDPAGVVSAICGASA